MRGKMGLEGGEGFIRGFFGSVRAIAVPRVATRARFGKRGRIGRGWLVSGAREVGRFNGVGEGMPGGLVFSSLYIVFDGHPPQEVFGQYSGKTRGGGCGRVCACVCRVCVWVSSIHPDTYIRALRPADGD